MVCPSLVLWMALLTAVGPTRASIVSGSVITTFISEEKLVCDCQNSIQDETIDYSVDVGLFVLAARWFAAVSPFVLAPFAALCPCGSTHSLESRSFPGLSFQRCNFDGLCYLGGLSAFLRVLMEVTALEMVRLTGTQLRALGLLACTCGSLSILASDCGWCLRVTSLMALFRACCLMRNGQVLLLARVSSFCSGTDGCSTCSRYSASRTGGRPRRCPAVTDCV